MYAKLEAIEKAKKDIMKKFMLWYIPRHDKILSIVKIADKLEEIIFNYCVEHDEVGLAETESLEGHLLPAIITFYEKF